jgi:stress-induced morphogen
VQPLQQGGGGSGGHSVNALSVGGRIQDESGYPASSGASTASWEPTAECPKPVAASIEHKMKDLLQATHVEVLDESAQHAGHAGARSTVSPSGETHLKVSVVSEAFVGLNTVKRHRKVYALLADELAGPVHALSLDTKTPSEL